MDSSIFLFLGALVAIVGGVIFYQRKKGKEKKQAVKDIPIGEFLPVAEKNPAGFPSAVQYKKWVEKYSFPVSSGEPTPVELSMDALKAAHTYVMGMMTYVADGGGDYSAPVWGDPYGKGDCEDFALAFRQACLDRGAPLSCMRIAHLQTEAGFWHGVCLVWVKGRGIISLDQRKPLGPWPLSEGGYILDKAAYEAGDEWHYWYNQ